MKYMTECSVCGGGTNNPKGRCVGHYTPPASHDAGEEFAKLRGSERHANYAETRYWCEQYRLFGSKAVDTIATLTAEVARLTGELAERRDAAEVFKGMYYIAAKDRDDARALMTQSQNKNALNWSEPYHCPAHKAAVKDWAAQVTANERLTEKLAASRQECERLREENKMLARLAYPVIRDPIVRKSGGVS